MSPVFLWSEPTYEWDEVVSLIADARSTERGKYGLTEEMYLTALDVLQIVSTTAVGLFAVFLFDCLVRTWAGFFLSSGFRCDCRDFDYFWFSW